MLLEQQGEHLVPGFMGRDPSYIFTFFSTYRAFATTQQVLEILFMRAISSILGTWLDHYPEEFFRPPDFTSLKLLRAYVRVHVPGSELQRRARLLYSWRKHPLAAALEPRPDVPRERAPAISVVPTAASRPRLPEATSSPGAQCGYENRRPSLQRPHQGRRYSQLWLTVRSWKSHLPLWWPQSMSIPQPQPVGSRKGWSNHLLQLSNQPQLPNSGSCWLQPHRMNSLTLSLRCHFSIGYRGI
ncbi:ral guanine nucleotide dissociation stimulator-like isoform X2 [Prionailurus bengalensis]|uniref:ral guanine nucleotide dissociation stimulator-like isoform X2 n=1 Tax=Prionailurus bengalensis TaxID=37029 RepID=UPI001CA9EC42|nr:ral guanine nucleotide dissociation stimulator-like isoform X2 [Prionailurus bengalensis]